MRTESRDPKVANWCVYWRDVNSNYFVVVPDKPNLKIWDKFVTPFEIDPDKTVFCTVNFSSLFSRKEFCPEVYNRRNARMRTRSDTHAVSEYELVPMHHMDTHVHRRTHTHSRNHQRG